MAFLGLGKKEEAGAAPPADVPLGPAPPPGPGAPPPYSPVDQIANMRGQGFDDNQIIQALQRDGLDAATIADAMNQANMQGGAAGPIPPPGPPGAPPGMPPGPPPAPPPGAPPPPGMPMAGPALSLEHVSEEQVREKIEEMAEIIIEEKWEAFTKDLAKLTEWKDKTDTVLTRLDQQFKEIKSDFDNLHRAIIGKIGEYDQNILNVGTEIKAMEKVFQKILPTFTENVSELSRLTKSIKPASPAKKPALKKK